MIQDFSINGDNLSFNYDKTILACGELDVDYFYEFNKINIQESKIELLEKINYWDTWEKLNGNGYWNRGYIKFHPSSNNFVNLDGNKIEYFEISYENQFNLEKKWEYKLSNKINRHKNFDVYFVGQEQIIYGKGREFRKLDINGNVIEEMSIKEEFIDFVVDSRSGEIVIELENHFEKIQM